MRKILLLGCPGSGKSTFGRKLRDKTGLPLFYLDQIWFREDKTTVPREVFDARLQKITSGPEWIIDGNYQRTIETRLKSCDTVFLFDLPYEVCLQGALERVGNDREDLPWKEREADPEFLQWIHDFPHDALPYIRELLKKYEGRFQLTEFHSREEADKFIETL